MILNGEKDTIKLGEVIADKIQAGTIIALIGDLGSGKTTLSKSIIKNLTNIDDVPSPTFNIVNEYDYDGKKIYHFDLYRLEDENELFGIGFDDYLSNKKAIILIEWADKFIEMLPKNYIKIDFIKNEESRDINIKSMGKKNYNIVDIIVDSCNFDK